MIMYVFRYFLELCVNKFNLKSPISADICHIDKIYFNNLLLLLKYSIILKKIKCLKKSVKTGDLRLNIFLIKSVFINNYIFRQYRLTAISLYY